MPELDDFETVHQHAKRLGKHPRTITRWCDEPDGLPYVRAGRDRLFRLSWTLQWLEAKRVHPNPTKGQAA